MSRRRASVNRAGLAMVALLGLAGCRTSTAHGSTEGATSAPSTSVGLAPTSPSVPGTTVGAIADPTSTPTSARSVQPVPVRGHIAFVGDSLTGMSSQQSLARLRAAGWAPITLNAQSGRRIPEAGTRKDPDGTVTKVISGIAAVQHIRATEPDAPTWIIGLGTNDIGATGPDPVAVRKVIEQMLDKIGPGHRIAWVNIHHGTDPEGTAVFNSVLAAVAAERTDLVVADWAALASTPGYLIDDHIHLTEAGKVAFADLVTATAERLALRPLDGHLVIRAPRAT